MKYLIPAILSIVVLCPLTNFAEAASSPILVKRLTEMTGSGKTRTTECAVSVDGVVITKEFDGITSVEEKAYKITGNIDAKMDDVAATKADVKKIAPTEFSYSSIAYRTSATGSRDALILGFYDGAKGEETQNFSTGAGVLRTVLNEACNK